MLIITKSQLQSFINESADLIQERVYKDSKHAPIVNMLVQSRFRHRSGLEKSTIADAIKDYLKSRSIPQEKLSAAGVDFNDVVDAVKSSSMLNRLQTPAANLRSQLK